VGIGFSLLGAVLWNLLTECRVANDVHNGKIVMILSQVCVTCCEIISYAYTAALYCTCMIQTFYRNIHQDGKERSARTSNSDAEEDEDEAEADGFGDRDSSSSQPVDETSRDRRQYLKELLISHPIWAEGRFWEQALWQCVLEQVH
jgi:hypothetical protein